MNENVVVISVSLHPSVLEHLDALASAERRSRSNMLETILRKAFIDTTPIAGRITSQESEA